MRRENVYLEIDDAVKLFKNAEYDGNLRRSNAGKPSPRDNFTADGQDGQISIQEGEWLSLCSARRLAFSSAHNPIRLPNTFVMTRQEHAALAGPVQAHQEWKQTLAARGERGY